MGVGSELRSCFQLNRSSRSKPGNSSNSNSSSSCTVSKCSSHLDKLIARVSVIEKDCCVDEKSKEYKLDQINKELLDEFSRLKAKMYLDLESIRILIRERKVIINRKGNNVESIERGIMITGEIKNLQTNFKRLADLYTKQCKNRKGKFENIDEKELEQRYNDLAVLKRQIMDCKSNAKSCATTTGLGKGESGGVEEYRTLTELRSEKLQRERDERNNQTTTETITGDDHTGLWNKHEEEDQQKYIQKWKKQDQEFDTHLSEIGQAIDRISEVAVQIGEKAEVGSEMVKELQTQADEATVELKLVNSKLKAVMLKQNNTTCCCRVVLGVLLIGLVVLFVSVLKKRIID